MMVVAAGLLATFAAPAPAEVDSGTAIGSNCLEFVAQPDVPYEEARQLIPEKYRDNYVVRPDELSTGGFGTLSDPSAKTAKLFVTGRRCDTLKVGDKTAQNVIDAYIAVPILEPGVGQVCDDPLDDQSCTTAPGEPAPNESGVTPLDPNASPIDEFLPLENYLVQWVTNSQLRANWLKQGAGLDAGVTVIEDPDLVFSYKPLAGTVEPNFTVKVTPPAPSPYTIKAKVTEPGGLAWYSGQNQWWGTGNRTLIIFAEAPVFFFGLQEGGTITAEDPNSPLGRAFGDKQDPGCERSGCVLAAFDGDKGITADPFEFNFYAEGFWTKCIRAVQSPCTRDE
jgi:hypothetical protein